MTQNRFTAKPPRRGKGYYWDPGRQRWVVRLSAQGREYYVGVFCTETDAIKASVQARHDYDVYGILPGQACIRQ